jgi:biopolymer transport protein ExbD
VTPPSAAIEGEAAAEPVLFADKSGRLHYDGAEGDAAIAALAAASADAPVVQLRADAELEAKALAGLMKKLAAAGLASIELVVSQ